MSRYVYSAPTSNSYPHILSKMSQSPRPFFDIPREIRSMIYAELYRIQDRNATTFFIERKPLTCLKHEGDLFQLSLFLSDQTLRINKQLAIEYLDLLLSTQCVRFETGPALLHRFLAFLNNDQRHKIKTIEIEWRTPPVNLIDDIGEFDHHEIRPLFDFIATET